MLFLFMSLLDTLNMCWHLWAHILLVSLAFVSDVTFTCSASINSIRMEKKKENKNKKKLKSTRWLHIRLGAPDANSLYNNLLNVILHQPTKLNKPGVAAESGHLCGCSRHCAAAQRERELLKWMLMYCSSSGLVDITASFLLKLFIMMVY